MFGGLERGGRPLSGSLDGRGERKKTIISPHILVLIPTYFKKQEEKLFILLSDVREHRGISILKDDLSAISNIRERRLYLCM